MKRREFVISAGCAALFAAVSGKLSLGLAAGPSSFSRNGKDRFLIGGLTDGVDRLFNPPKHQAGDENGKLQMMNLRTKEIKSFEIGFNPHSFTQHPHNSNCVAATAKWTRFGGLFDLQKGELIKRLQAPEPLRYFGHTAFDENGYLYTSAASYVDDQGFILIYEPKTWSLVKKLPTGGSAAHDFFFIDRNTLLIANSGYSSSIGHDPHGSLTWLNVKTGVVTRSLSVLEPIHVALVSPKEVVIGGIPVSSPLGHLYRVNLGTGRSIEVNNAKGFDPSFARGEKTSLGLINGHTVVATGGKGEKVFFWDLRANKVHVAKDFHSAMRGLAILDKELLVSNQEGSLISIPFSHDGETIGEGKELFKRFSNSTHLKLIWV
jgi:WD40 repeat protein